MGGIGHVTGGVRRERDQLSSGSWAESKYLKRELTSGSLDLEEFMYSSMCRFRERFKSTNARLFLHGETAATDK